MKKCVYRKGYKYQLAVDYTHHVGIYPAEDIETEFLSLNKSGTLMVRSGYAWDGPSGPTFDTKSFMRGSLVHDALYQLLALKLIKRNEQQTADMLLKSICKEDGMNGFRAWYVYQAVRHFGAAHIQRKQLYIAP